jgi:hypothetical protein
MNKVGINNNNQFYISYAWFVVIENAAPTDSYALYRQIVLKEKQFI